MNAIADEAVVPRSVRLKAPIGRVQRLHRADGTWWPASHHIGKTAFQAIVVEPRVGGKWYEQDAAGERREWGTVRK